MTDEQRKELIAALLREKHGYERYGHPDRAAEVQAEIDKLARHPKAPAKRATRMTPDKRTEL